MAGGDVPTRPTYLGDSRLDDVARMVFELTSELWVLKDRTIMLETLLAQNGVVAPGALDAAQPDADLQLKLAEERKALVARVYGAVLDSDTRAAAALAR
ncbi:hypothetical protein [Microbacterium hatanonis]|uniref:hypothetical protein n=1 Tax=Microbacterium hatanonis TaxID=404366 RepID=UPI00164EE6BE|nr:hypothetical protein [Microbacterium hatanonis]